MKYLLIILGLTLLQGCFHNEAQLEQENAVILRMNNALAESDQLRAEIMECQIMSQETRSAMEECCGSQGEKIERMFEKALIK